MSIHSSEINLGRASGAGPALRLLTLLGLALGAAACGQSDPVAKVCPPTPPLTGEVPGDDSDARLTITNSQAELDARMTCPNQKIAIDEASGTPRAKAESITLTLQAEIQPPRVNGEVVQATSIAMDGGDKAVVSYNMRGAPRMGAIDYFEKLLEQRPVLRSSATFSDSDISAVVTDGTFVYAAEATSATGFPSPAVLERLKLSNSKFVLEDNLRIGLTSFAGTGVMRTSNEIYATSGDSGHVFAFEKSNLGELGRFALSDARWAAWDQDGKRIVVVQGGQPNGQISVFTEGSFPAGSMTLENTWSFDGANVPESKSTVDVAGGKAFIAAGPEGVQILCLATGAKLGEVPRPDPQSLGLDPSVVVTNSVTVDEDLMFISNGEAGIYVASADEEFKDTGCTQQDVQVLGRLRFSDLQSANHVEYVNDYLFVAAGLGGVKIIRVDD